MKVTKSNPCPVPNGILLIVGGHEDKTESNTHPQRILKKFIEPYL